MAQELDVLGLRKKIETMKCDPYEPYAFISYSHDNHDASIVYRIFKRLYEMGYNLWIDTANLPYNAENWTKAAIGALRKKECKLALFFRSESSMLKDTIGRELETIDLIDHIDSTIVIDIWEDENNSAAAYRKKIANGEDDVQYETFMKICDVVKPDCNAFRFAADYHNDIDNIAKALAISLDRGGIYCDKSRSNPVNNVEKVVVEKPQIEKPVTTEVKQVFSAPVNKPTKAKSPSEYRYTIFGKECYAGSGGQGQLMFDAFEALTERYPQKVEALTELSSVIQAEKVDGNDNPPVYFRTKKRFTVAGKDYYVGTSFSLGDKLTQIKKMFQKCGESPDEFVLLKEGETAPKPSNNISSEEPKPAVNTEPVHTTAANTSTTAVIDEYVYTIFGEEYRAGSKEQGKLMYDVFEALTKRFPQKADAMTAATSVALADTVEYANDTKRAYPTYFRACKKFEVAGKEYYVGTSYGFKAKLDQINKMLNICGVPQSAFVLVSYPELAKRPRL
ncbi:toll/interleukin-1 receptor domain-containing protein [Ruminococcus sp.]|uniref:toll/interleukin-1 receptor domain-containing protein n=1 Tax=Ruminococcus sp. TaxID=41978 RepID=UPI0025EC7299|nr:toll/interleukin-1 receptor domain-containing protein [Ruminococcus sp.]